MLQQRNNNAFKVLINALCCESQHSFYCVESQHSVYYIYYMLTVYFYSHCELFFKVFQFVGKLNLYEGFII